ncbi:MAG: hypothetical protein FWG67_07275 [Defluviitaleaceae bacterium]|nr:hypothetical protein [Defluviitaleaceae bacterium]
MVDTNKIVINDQCLPSPNALELIEGFNKYNSKNKKQVFLIDYLFEKELGSGEILVKVVKKDKKQPVKFLSHYYKCGIDEKKRYDQLLINPALGKFKWCVTYHKENVECAIAIQESIFTPEMLDEVMNYIMRNLTGVKDVYIETYRHVEKMKFTEIEYEQFINDGQGFNKYGIPIVLN